MVAIFKISRNEIGTNEKNLALTRLLYKYIKYLRQSSNNCKLCHTEIVEVPKKMKMKKLLLTLSCIVIFACNKNDDDTTNCNFLFDANINLVVNTNLPQFLQLQFNDNKIYVSGYGNNGIWLYRANSTTLYAWDAADPSHQPTACSTLTDSGIGDIVVCGCNDENQYSLATGYPFGENTQPCTLQAYRVESIGNNEFLVSN